MPSSCSVLTMPASPTERMFIHYEGGDEFFEVVRHDPKIPTIKYCAMGDGRILPLTVTPGWPLVNYNRMVAGRLRGATVYTTERIKEN